MNLFKRASPPDRVPTLTEVVEPAPELEQSPLAPGTPSAIAPLAVSAVSPPVSPAPALVGPRLAEGGAPPPALSPDDLAQEILRDVQRQVDAMLEYRMKEVLGPVLNRLTDALVRDARAELGSVLKDVVGRAVAQELAKRRTP